MTTDTHHKLIRRTFKGKKEYTVAGIAKGSGMINPNFATMLAFVFTDYPVEPQVIKAAFRAGCEGELREDHRRWRVQH